MMVSGVCVREEFIFFFRSSLYKRKKKDRTIKRKNKIKKGPLHADGLKDWFFLSYHNCISKSQHRKLIIFYMSRKIPRTMNVSLSVG